MFSLYCIMLFYWLPAIQFQCFFVLVIIFLNLHINFISTVADRNFARMPRNKNERVVCVRNLTPEDLLKHATRLRNALGRKVVKLKTRHVTKHPSVQGTWTPDTKFESLNEPKQSETPLCGKHSTLHLS
ncbi:hypothetical protein MKW92_019763 [Papaver armeniacum]|nr:hypothetical protein MKW92_019763 [Papaver armeniacum]